MIFGKSADELMDEGYALLAEGDYERALKTGEKLLKRRHTSGFEITARAWWNLGDTEKAIQTLEDGVKITPEIWIFWDYLGQYYSDTGKYQNALASFQQIFQLPDADLNANHYNIALTYFRMGEMELSERELSNIQVSDDHLLLLYKETLRASIANAREQWCEATRIAKVMINHPLVQNVETYELAPIYTHLARAVYQLEGETPEMKAWLKKAIESDKSWEGIQTLIRELRNERSDTAHRYRVMIEGTLQINPNEAPLGFFTTYFCIADNPEEALEFIREFEPSADQGGLKISESERLEPAPNELKGVYWAQSGYTFFQEVN